MNWDPVALLQQMRCNAARKYHAYKKKDLVERVLQLEAALYPFAYTLGALDYPDAVTAVTSNMFPATDNVNNGAALPADFQVLAVRQGSYSCGSVSMSDVRHAVNTLGREWI